MFNNNRISILLVFLLFCSLLGCAEEGEEGSSGIDCGDNGSEHDGHCHCDAGYLFNGETCVTPSEITELCEEPLEGEHQHHACVCPASGECFCDGEIVNHEGIDYCELDLHEEEYY